MPPFTPNDARSWMDNGIMFALSLLVVWGLALALLLGFKWINRKMNPPDVRQCDGCAFAEDWRSPEDLVAHRLFGYLRLARASMIPNLPIRDAGRRLVFTDLLDVKCRVVADLFQAWLKKHLPALESMHPDTLAYEQLNLIGEIVEAYEAEVRRMGMPPAVLEKFRYWHGPRIAHLRSEVTMVCESEWISDVPQRIGFILSVVEQVMKATVFDAEKTLNSLNGALTGHVYKGVTIGPCDHRKDPDSGITRAVAPLNRP